MDHNELCRMDAVALAEQIRTNGVSPVEVTEAVLARMERLQPYLHGFCTPTPDRARAEAKQIETDIMAGRLTGPLAGVPVSYKDLILTKGIRTTSGSLAYKDFVPDEDDVVVERLHAAGTVMLGKTNAPEFGKRVAYSADWGYAPVDRAVRRIAGSAVRVFERELGCMVEEVNPGWDDPSGVFYATMFADSDLKGMRELMRKYPMSGHLVDGLMTPWTAEDFTTASMMRKSVVRKMAQFMSRYDLLLTPTGAVPPFPIHMQGPEKIDGRYVRPAQFIAFTFPLNLTGQPAANVPAGWTEEGLPVGLQIVGRHLEDWMVLRASANYEAAARWRDKWPPMLTKLGL